MSLETLDFHTYATQHGFYMVERATDGVNIWNGEDDVIAVLMYVIGPNGRTMYREQYVTDVMWTSVEAWLDANA